MTILDVTLILGVILCDSTGLYLNFLGSQPSSAAQMSSLRSDDKVCSTSSKSKWTCRLAPASEVGAERGKVTSRMDSPLDMQVIGDRPLFCTPMLTQARVLQRLGLGRANPRVMLCVVLPVFAPGSCRALSSCQTASYTSSCKASSRCPR